MLPQLGQLLLNRPQSHWSNIIILEGWEVGQVFSAVFFLSCQPLMPLCQAVYFCETWLAQVIVQRHN